MPQIQQAENIANHVAIVLDASSSMRDRRHKTIEVTDRLIADMATRSKSYNQETRVSIWVFSGYRTVRCVIWDMDVLRLPSIEKLYHTEGMTALIDATLKSIDDLSTVSQIYGNHAFLMYVMTDGEENESGVRDPQILANRIKGLPNNWTVAAMVPNIQGVAAAKGFGFPAGNIQIWDATSDQGVEEAHQVMVSSLDSYMNDRASGMKSTTGLFDMSAAAVNKATISAAGLTPLDPSEYILTTVVFKPPFQDGDDWISNYTANVLGHQYVSGRGFYQLTLAPVKVQIQKDIAIVEKKSGMVYTGKNARALLGLPGNLEVTLRASQNPDYDIYIQSTSANRKLLVGQKYLYLTPNVTYVKGQSVVSPPVKTAPKVAKMPLAQSTVARRAAAKLATGSMKAKADLTAPVYPKAGKALWAGIKCPSCPAEVNRRCQKPDGSLLEKPHTQRKV